MMHFVFTPSFLEFGYTRRFSFSNRVHSYAQKYLLRSLRAEYIISWASCERRNCFSSLPCVCKMMCVPWVSSLLRSTFTQAHQRRCFAAWPWQAVCNEPCKCLFSAVQQPVVSFMNVRYTTFTQKRDTQALKCNQRWKDLKHETLLDTPCLFC